MTLAREVLTDVPSGTSSLLVARSFSETVSRGEPGNVACPACHNVLPVGPELAGERVQCARCQSVLHVQSPQPDTIVLSVVSRPGSPSWTQGVPGSDRSGAERLPTLSGELPMIRDAVRVEPVRVEPPPARGARRWLTYGLLGLVLMTCGLFLRREIMSLLSDRSGRVPGRPPAAAGADGDAAPDARGQTPAPGPTADGPVVINIAYGTEKKKWLEAALKEFSETAKGKQIKVNLYGMGSVEGANAVLDGPTPTAPPHQPIHVWSPASSTYRDVLESEWRVKHPNSNPILTAQDLALTPMVFVMWKKRHDAFVKKFPKLNFHTVAEAMKEPGGWGGIAGQPEWGLFKFGHTDPNKSNSGLQALVLMAYEFSNKDRDLTVKDITRSEFQDWLRAFEVGVTRHGTSLTHSTGTLMEEMVLRGPSQYDCLILYENLAIDYMRSRGRALGRRRRDLRDLPRTRTSGTSTPTTSSTCRGATTGSGRRRRSSSSS